MAQTTVVNIKNTHYDIYIGRPGVLSNPYRLGKYSREEAIALYKTHFYDFLTWNSEFLAAALATKGKVLGCHCKPLACHGDIIAEWANKQ